MCPFPYVSFIRPERDVTYRDVTGVRLFIRINGKQTFQLDGSYDVTTERVRCAHCYGRRVRQSTGDIRGQNGHGGRITTAE